MTFPHADRTIFLTLAGSQAHGTAREGSDVDVRGVCVVPLAERLSVFERFTQHEGPFEGALAARVLPAVLAHPTAARGLAVKAEMAVFDVARFVELCAGANPNALELLFADERDWLLATPPWRRLHAARHLFLTRKLQQTFLGYALAQLKRIRTHRAWLLDPPQRRPEREDFGLPPAGATLGRDDQNRIEAALADKIRSWGLDDVDMPKPARIALAERLEGFVRDVLATPADEVEARLRAVATHALALPREVVAALDAEKRYRAAMKHWESYRTWQAERNEARAALERRHGYDTKHAMHLVRLMRMGLEVLERGELVVRRPDAGELLAIRDGALSFDELFATAEALRAAMERAAATSTLPADVDRERVDAVARDIMLADGGER